MFQKRADLLLQGDIGSIIDAYATPMLAKFRDEFHQIADRDAMWAVLARQHLSQKARGITAIAGRLESQDLLLHDRMRLSILWQETGPKENPDAARDFRVVYICRTAGGALVITGMSVEETKAPAQGLRAPVFPPPCEDW
jgi:hypothetical protein